MFLIVVFYRTLSIYVIAFYYMKEAIVVEAGVGNHFHKKLCFKGTDVNYNFCQNNKFPS